ncbi:unnamed protein product, partial [Didymodactylos carnosus]
QWNLLGIEWTIQKSYLKVFLKLMAASIFREHQSFRDINYMYELDNRYGEKWWSINGGYCIRHSLSYKQFGCSSYDSSMLDSYVYYVEYVLTHALDADCNYNSPTTCQALINTGCKTTHLYYSSQGAILTSYLQMLFRKQRNWSIREPGYLDFIKNTNLKCRGQQAISDEIGVSTQELHVFEK